MYHDCVVAAPRPRKRIFEYQKSAQNTNDSYRSYPFCGPFLAQFAFLFDVQIVQKAESIVESHLRLASIICLTFDVLACAEKMESAGNYELHALFSFFSVKPKRETTRKLRKRDVDQTSFSFSDKLGLKKDQNLRQSHFLFTRDQKPQKLTADHKCHSCTRIIAARA